jgi:hypothetical protein
MLQELTFVDSVLLITVSTLAAVRGKFSCRNTPKFTTRPELGSTKPLVHMPDVLSCASPELAEDEDARSKRY